MSADLRERVARALAYQAWKVETFWEMYLPESDAVLAELGLTQAEPVAWPVGVLNREATLDTLTKHNAWRRGAIGEQTDARLLGLALDAAIAALKAAPQPQAVEVPDALVTIARRLLADRKKNNHFTADPIYTVQRETRIYGLDTDYAQHFAWIEEDSELCPAELSDRLERRFNRGWTIPDRYRRVGYCTRWEFVDAYLSYEAAKERAEYESRKHSGKYRTYVESGCRNHEWKALQAWLLSLADAAPQPQPQVSAEDERALWGVVANAGRLSAKRKVRWAHVSDATGLGSNKSAELCRRFERDPDELVGGGASLGVGK